MRQLLSKILCCSCLLIANGFQLVNSQPINFLKLPRNTDISTVSWKDSIYRFPVFQKGKITYKTGKLDHEFDLNYNRYFEKMDFISSSRDTLSITNTREIRSVQVGYIQFFHDYNEGFYEVILDSPIALGVKQQFVFQNSKVSGAVHFADLRGVVGNHDRFYEIVSRYVFIDKSNRVHRATRASILKLFPAHSEKLSAYVREHRTDFSSRKDLLALLTFCKQIASL